MLALVLDQFRLDRGQPQDLLPKCLRTVTRQGVLTAARLRRVEGVNLNCWQERSLLRGLDPRQLLEWPAEEVYFKVGIPWLSWVEGVKGVLVELFFEITDAFLTGWNSEVSTLGRRKAAETEDEMDLVPQLPRESPALISLV